MKRSMILTDQAFLTRFVSPQDDGAVIEPVEIPGSMPFPGRPREEFRMDATFEMNIRSTSGKNIQLSFDLTDGRHLIDTNELLSTISESFMEAKNGWDSMDSNAKRYRLTLEEI